MSLELMMITNNPEIALEAEMSGVNRIFIDLEINGKEERQGHLDTVISRHQFEDIKKVKSVLKKSKVLVRINPLYNDTKYEIEKSIELGADIIMLPMAKNANEVEKFTEIINGRVKTCLLLETSEALVRIDDILEIKGLDEIHIGLNDLHLSLGLDFMFEPLSGGIIEYLSKKIIDKNIKFGFGGITKVGEGLLPAEYIIREHVRLKSEMVILSRSFHNRAKEITDITNHMEFKNEVNKIRKIEKECEIFSREQFEYNKLELKNKVDNILKK